MKTLNTPINVTINGEPCKVPYRAVMRDKQGLRLAIEQKIKGKWRPTRGVWSVSSSLLVSLATGKWIDFGLGWRLEPNPGLAVEVALITGQMK